MAERPRLGWLPLGAGAAGLVLAAMLAPLEPAPLPLEVRWLAAYLLFVLLPGWLVVRTLLPTRPMLCLETALLAIAAGYGLAVLLGLALHTAFRPIAPWQIAAGGGLLVAALAVAAQARTSSRAVSLAPSPNPTPRPRAGEQGAARSPRHALAGGGGGEVVRRLAPVAGLLLVTAPLRLLDLGWSEFQGDEARVVLRAMAALQGADGALAAHRKVPGEILVAYLFAGSLGQIVEQLARLPFALAGVGAVLAFYALARGLFGGPAALAAGLLLAVNGYFVAFGRILQYDSLSFFLGIAGLICCWRFGQVAERSVAPDTGRSPDVTPPPLADGTPVAWAALGALLLAGAALVALGAVFLLPPALLLAWPGLVRHACCWRVLLAWSWPLVPSLLAAVLVLGSGDTSEGPSGVWSYLGPRLGGDRPYWHAALFLQSANHYLSTPYLLVMLAAGAVALPLRLREVARATDARGMVIRLTVAVMLAALTWDRPRAALVIGVLLALGLALQAVGRRQPEQLGMRVALAWAAGPLFVHLFLIRVPGTHWREAFPGLILVLAALLAPALAHQRARYLAGAVVGALVVGAGHYAWVTLVQRVPEYQLEYPEHRHPLDWTDRDGRGIGGVFGSVHRHGWKALGVLSARGALPDGFATNESPAIAAWYLRRPQGCAGELAYVFRVSRAPHDRNLALPVPLPSGYQTRGRVRVQGRATIAIQTPLASGGSRGDIAAEAYLDAFDRELASVWRPVGELYLADLGAASARRACAERNQPGDGSVNPD